jgi:acetyltransferase-like isoleucine patch superfamily enzyme
MKLKKIVGRVFEPIRIEMFNIKWRKANVHNQTIAGNRFDIHKVSVGKKTYGKLNVYDYNDPAAGKLVIGNYCSIAQSVMFLLSGNHEMTGLLTYPMGKKEFKINQCETKGNIVIEDDVWIGEKAMILSGVHIHQGAIVAAGAVVVNDVPPYSVVGGWLLEL